MAAAREHGIDFLDDARYDDRTGSAPLRTGYSEVVFGELFRAAGWRRDAVVVANKLWWEFWPRQSASEEFDASLGRMGLDYLDLVYSALPPAGLELADAVRAVAELIAAGKARAWGMLNWPADVIVDATRIALEEGLPVPCAAQLPYNVVFRSPVEDPDTVDALGVTGAGVIASAVLAFGALTGKYASKEATGRIAAELEDPFVRPALRAAQPLGALAERLDTTAAALAIAFALANPQVASVLFGATRPEQIAENAAATDVLSAISGDELAELRHIGAAAVS
jgi:aryl-alcohol dehydrogenase-like predicted oxidoreductase